MSLRQSLVRFAFNHRRVLKKLIPIHGPVLVRLDGFSMYVRLDDWAVGARIAVRRRYEPHVVSVFSEWLRPGATVVDVGANIGFYALTSAARIGPGGHVFAFEPAGSSCELLRRSARYNAFENIEVFECAVSDVEGIVGFGMDDSNGRISHEEVGTAPLHVRSVMLDRTLAHVTRVDVMKIDVEGAEARVLRGARGLINRCRPVVFSECCPYGLRLASATEPDTFLEELRSLGYELRVLPVSGQPTRALSNSEILAEIPGIGPEHHIDLLAIPVS